ncbi:MAG: sigma-70 family RNA polymerase sigma factor, partial [Actinomycetota bacterium]
MAPDQAFDGLYRRYAHDVYRFAYGLVRNRADAEDVAQSAFLNAYRALERGHEPESPRNWLLAIAQNVHRQHLRRSQRRVQEVALDVELAVEENTALDPSEITRALDQLSANQRAALVLR